MSTRRPTGGLGPRDLQVVALAILLILAGCGGATGSAATGSPSAAAANPDAIVAEIASYQMVAGRPGRLLVALVTGDNRWLSFGTVRFSFSYLGDGTATTDPGITMADATADFLPIPGSPDGEGQAPTLTLPSDGHGVYAAREITFPRAGYWQMTASGELADGSAFGAAAAVEAVATPSVLQVGDEAPRTENAVIGDPGVVDPALDSRAISGDPIPDPELHATSIAGAIETGRPALIVFSTPVFCVSRFCGPVTDLIAELAADYGDRAAFIHVEIWRDFEAEELSPAVAEWLIGPDGSFREPWTFLVGADGRIAGSWDTVVTRGEIEPLLQALPAT